MATYDLVMFVTDEFGERTGKRIKLSTVADGEVTGRMIRATREQINLGSIRIGITGPIVEYTADDADMVAYALGRSNGAFDRHNIEERGDVVAVDVDGNEVPFRYRPQSVLSDVIMPE